MTLVFDVRQFAVAAIVGAALSITTAIPASADPNFEYFRDYEEAYLEACGNSFSAAQCQCLMEAAEAALSFDRFARLMEGGAETLMSDPAYLAATKSTACVPLSTAETMHELPAVPVAQHNR